ncbi:hypothetical protein [Aeromicrobium sp. 179-A 4D2 NHS]|uniref:hypothetical protein n=1 Tax=Aeromicrobium sp. 179-A 4D2 NHS TaxID=3142375 RepID=UPI0039A16FA5
MSQPRCGLRCGERTPKGRPTVTVTTKPYAGTYIDAGHITGYGARLDTYQPGEPTANQRSIETSSAEFVADVLRQQAAVIEERLRQAETAVVIRKVHAQYPDAASIDVDFNYDGASGYARVTVFDADDKWATCDADGSDFSESTIRRYVLDARERASDRWVSQVSLNFKIADWVHMPGD